MTTAKLINKLISLPRRKRAFIAVQLIHSLSEEGDKKIRRRKSKRSISPSNDSWWDNPDNVQFANEAFEKAKHEKGTPIDECPQYAEMKRIIAQADNTKKNILVLERENRKN
jgi:hypothetical protein